MRHYIVVNNAKALPLLYVTIYDRATQITFSVFDSLTYFLRQILTVCPILYCHLSPKRNSPRSRRAARGRAFHPATNIAHCLTLWGKARRRNPALARGDVLFFFFFFE